LSSIPIINISFGFDETGFVFKHEHELGYNLTRLAIDTATSTNFIANAGGWNSVDGIYFTSWDSDTPGYKELERKISENGDTPEQPLFAAAGYDATMYVAEAMKTGESGKALHDAMYIVKNFKGITGDLSMDPDGAVRTVKEKIFQIKNEQFVLV